MSYIIREKNWRISRSVPLSMLFMLAFQIVAVIIWASRLDERVDGMSRDIEVIRKQVEHITDKLIR